jgi:vacuolar-type H+-ATPase subunit I/STV1
MNTIVDFLTIKNVFRVLVFVIMFGYVVYSFLLALRVKILSQTLKTKVSKVISLLGYIHFVIVLISVLVIGIMILS